MNHDRNPSNRPPPPPPAILDRFRLRLKEEEKVGPIGASEIVRLYEEVLVELTSNSKPVITELSIIAGEQREHAAGIADVICDRILKVPSEQKLPSMYLLDSIAKNVGLEYLRCFGARLHEVFLETYRNVNSNLHPAMLRLFRTWASVFRSSELCTIEDFLKGNQKSASSEELSLYGSQSSRLLHDIHVNSKSLDANDHQELSALDAQHTRISSTLQAYRQNDTLKHGDYDLVRHEGLPPQDDFGRIASGAMGEFINRSSLSGFASGRPSIRNDALTKIWPSGDGPLNPNHSGAYRNINGCDKVRARLLIDAYGRIDASHEKMSKIQRLNVDGNNSNLTLKDSWNSEKDHLLECMSPTLPSKSKISNITPFGHNTGLTRSSAVHIRKDFGTDWHDHSFLSQSNDPANPTAHPGRTYSDKFQDDVASRKETMQLYENSYRAEEPLKFTNVLPESSQHTSAPISRGKLLEMPYSSHETSLVVAQRKHSYVSGACQGEAPSRRILCSHSNALNLETPTIKKHAQVANFPDATEVTWPSVHKSQPLPQPSHQLSTSSESSMPTADVRSEQSFLPTQQFGNDNRTKFNPTCSYLNLDRSQQTITPATETLELTPITASHHVVPQAQTFCHEQAQGAVISPNLPNLLPSVITRNILPLQAQYPHYTFRPQHLPVHPAASAVAPHSSASVVALHPSAIPLPRHPAPHPFNPAPPLPSITTSSYFRPSILPPVVTPNNSLTFYPPGPLPSRPSGLPSSSEIRPATKSTNAVISELPTSTYSDLFNSLVAKGLISAEPPNPSQDAVGVDFSTELLKVRHESSIHALYGDLSRQCTTCGLRFRSQEDHSSHMDWHVTKNRVAKNQKQRSSRNWYVTAKEWLSGAEALGADVLPGFFLTEPTVDKKEEKEVAVIADEDQSTCALCGERFDDFYSDEMEEWLYKGAVYLNAPNGSIEGVDRSNLGPIVHAKCLPESADCFGSG